MDHPDREVAPQFSRPVRQIMAMLVVLVLVGLGAYVAYPRVAPVFLANPWLNGVILLVFVIGVLACFFQVFQLTNAVSWLEGFAARRPGHEITTPPRLLASLAALLRSRNKRMQLTAYSSRSILDSVATRIDEVRDITRYIVNLLIFLGLLGTFYGLATTVPAVVETIRSLAPAEGEGGVDVFGRLITGLEAQLGGMGTAFASSLLGLAGSLVVGLLELFASHGQNRFYRELEEWLSSITRLGFSFGDGELGPEQSAMVSVLEHLAEQMELMQSVVTQSETRREDVDQRLDALSEAIDRLARRTAADDGTLAALGHIADGQERLIAAVQSSGEDGGGHVDAESRMRLRSIDVQLLRILEELSAGRQESLSDLRADLAALTKAVRQAARESGAMTTRQG